MKFKCFLEKSLRENEQVFAVFVIAVINGKYTATTRAKDKEEFDENVKYGFPGGKVDQGETVQETALRESKEEGWHFDSVSEPFFKTVVQGKTVAWCKGNNPKMLSNYKEKQRGIKPVLVDENKLKGFGNEEAIKAFLDLREELDEG